MPGHIDKKLIYVLDDDEDVLILLKKILQNLGMDAETFLTPESFILKFKEKKPDLCFIDLNLGKNLGAGFQVIQAIRKKITDQVILIVLSARDSSEDITQALEMGCNDYINKPIRAAIIENKLRQHFKTQDDVTLPSVTVPNDFKACTLELDYYLYYINEEGFTILTPHFIPTKSKILFDSGIVFEIFQKPFSLRVEQNWLNDELKLYATSFVYPDDDPTYKTSFRNWKLVTNTQDI